MENIMRVAFSNGEWNTVAYIMVQYYAQYVEGEMESSKDKFNKLLPRLPIEALEIMKKYCVGMFKPLDELLDRMITSKNECDQTGMEIDEHLER